MGKAWYQHIWSFRKTLIVVFTPLLWLPIPILYSTEAGRCAYSICIMATYWMTEAIPMAATALLPILLFPWLGVMGSKDLCKNYLKDTNFLFFSGLLIAVAVEKWNLHKRIALRVLTIVGCKPQWLMFGFMTTTAFLSMWLSNTATAAMLMPIAHAVLEEMNRNRKEVRADDEAGMISSNNSSPNLNIMLDKEAHSLHAMENGLNGDTIIGLNDETPHIRDPDGTKQRIRKRNPSMSDKAEKEFKTLSAGMKISIAVAANIGGTGTLTGTGPNIVLKGQVDTMYVGEDTGLNFSSWFLFAFPNMVLCLLFSWLWMSFFFIGIKKTFTCRRRSTPQEMAANAVIRNEYQKLGNMSFAEVSVAIFFTLLAVLWFTREPAFMPGWGDLPFLRKGFITDACVGMSIAVLLFMFPAEKPNFLCFRSKSDDREPTPSPALLDWETVHSKMAWSVIVVLGGSFALADACQHSGLSQDVGTLFNDLMHLPPWVLTLLLCFITGVITNVTSNTATATIFLPVVKTLAESAGIHPFYLMIPVGITASLAFVLPVATPPNAIVFAYGQTKISDMFKSGIMLNIVTILIVQFSINTYGMKIFDLGHYPDWATQPAVLNATTSLPAINGSLILNVIGGNATYSV